MRVLTWGLQGAHTHMVLFDPIMPECGVMSGSGGLASMYDLTQKFVVMGDWKMFHCTNQWCTFEVSRTNMYADERSFVNFNKF